MPLHGLCRPPSALTNLRSLSLLRHRRRSDHARHCSTLVATRGSADVSNLQNGLADAVKAGLGLSSGEDESTADLQQRTEQWQGLRKGRITASAFGNALGFWKTGRTELWEEKLGLRKPFAGNQATVWGTNQEAGAIERYKQLTGNVVEHIAFKIYKEGDELHGWLGASPDGLINASLSRTYTNGGILEVKCPHNKGSPETGSPWTSVPHYYMPQAQGLLEIFDREWLDFYVWCVNGSSIYRIYRDETYWGLIFRVMSEYWWGNIVPARHHLQKGEELDRVQAYRPQAKHPLTDEIMSMSRLLAVRAPLIWKDVKTPALGSDQHLREKLELFYHSL
ncbi:hypothetical protein KC19_10G015300 [Ceratodon purpureus]|uniref:YqaJ viral recombinase domain-containing protein n=1 Tax=Ceratodon purpureus TaxID=3225 RepID=A0A8T0GIA0_CERPU|nr:hypothetical protein KC19_10G015300 [Ceratodon purpureus]